MMPSKLAVPDLDIPHVSWGDFLRQFTWRQGEHLSLIAPNGKGKSIVAREVLDRRKWVIVFVTKSKDKTLDSYKKKGYEVLRTWPPPPDMQKILLWPVGKPDEAAKDKALKRKVFKEALTDVYRRGGWTVYFDEVRYITQSLRLSLEAEELWMQGRSMEITVVGSTQRPSWVPLEAYSEIKHLFLWDNPDMYNLRRLGEISNIAVMEPVLRKLGYHEFAYLNTRNGDRAISSVDRSLVA